MPTRYSFLKGLGKVLENVLEILTAILLTMLPQLISLLVNTLLNTPAEQLHVPVEWSAGWYFLIRLLRNWWKNR